MKHPLEDVFNMDEGTSFIQQQYGELAEQPPVNPTVEAVQPPPDFKDADDIDTDKKIDEVYNAALTTFQNQIAYTEIIEPRYAARNAEVASTFLSIALQAAATKAKSKSDRKRANAPFIPFSAGGKTTNNTIICDRNDILRMINIDGEMKELK